MLVAWGVCVRSTVDRRLACEAVALCVDALEARGSPFRLLELQILGLRSGESRGGFQISRLAILVVVTYIVVGVVIRLPKTAASSAAAVLVTCPQLVRSTHGQVLTRKGQEG